MLSSPVQSRASVYGQPCPWERSGRTRRGTGSLRQGELGGRESRVSRTWLRKPRQPWSGRTKQDFSRTWAHWSGRRRACPAAQVKWGTLFPPFGAWSPRGLLLPVRGRVWRARPRRWGSLFRRHAGARAAAPGPRAPTAGRTRAVQSVSLRPADRRRRKAAFTPRRASREAPSGLQGTQEGSVGAAVGRGPLPRPNQPRAVLPPLDPFLVASPAFAAVPIFLSGGNLNTGVSGVRSLPP